MKSGFIFGLIGVASGCLGIGFAIGIKQEVDKVCDKLDTAFDELANVTEIELEEEVINTAMNKAIDKYVAECAQKAVRKVTQEFEASIRNTVRDEVKRHEVNIRNLVSDQIAEQIKRIDRFAVRDDIVKKATEKIVEDTSNGVKKEAEKEIEKIVKNFSDSMDNLKSLNIALNRALVTKTIEI